MRKKIRQKFYAFLSRILPGNLRILSVYAADYCGLISGLSIFKIALKEKIKEKGILDYKKEEIIMKIDSLQQVKRLAACRKEPETVRWIEEYLMPGDVLYDIGANIGAYSLVAWRVSSGKQNKIYAIEPSFSTFASLCLNIILNKASKEIIPLQIALSDQTRLADFNYSQISPGSASHTLGDISSKSADIFCPAVSLSMPSYRLDDLIEKFNLDFPSHIKIDVDGAEVEVLKGAERVLSDRRLKSILVEVDTVTDGNQIYSVLEKSGLRLISKYPRQRKGLYNFIFAR